MSRSERPAKYNFSQGFHRKFEGETIQAAACLRAVANNETFSSDGFLWLKESG